MVVLTLPCNNLLNLLRGLVDKRNLASERGGDRGSYWAIVEVSYVRGLFDLRFGIYFVERTGVKVMCSGSKTSN
jgi:hypothetical protein